VYRCKMIWRGRGGKGEKKGRAFLSPTLVWSLRRKERERRREIREEWLADRREVHDSRKKGKDAGGFYQYFDGKDELLLARGKGKKERKEREKEGRAHRPAPG